MNRIVEHADLPSTHPDPIYPLTTIQKVPHGCGSGQVC